MLSALPLERLGTLEGATWLDRSIAAGDPGLARDAGFGREVRSALAARQVWLVGEGLAQDHGGAVVFRPDLIATLQRRELLRVTSALSTELKLPFVEAEDGMRVAGRVNRRLELASGSHAVIENSREFTLVPWRPVLSRAIGQEVSGLVNRGDISWSLGRDRGPQI